MCWFPGKIYSHVRNNFVFTLFLYNSLSYQTDTYLNEIFLEIYWFFWKNGIKYTFYSCQMSMLKIDTSTSSNRKIFWPIKT